MAKPPSRVIRLVDVQDMVLHHHTSYANRTTGDESEVAIVFRQYLRAVSDRYPSPLDYENRGHALEGAGMAAANLLIPIAQSMLDQIIANALPQGPFARRHGSNSFQARRVIPDFGQPFADGRAA